MTFQTATYSNPPFDFPASLIKNEPVIETAGAEKKIERSIAITAAAKARAIAMFEGNSFCIEKCVGYA